MNQTSSDTVVLLSHGAWHIPEHYARLQELLQQASFPVFASRFPTMNGSVPPNKTFEDDVDTLQAEALSLIDQGLRVVVLCHSYGGFVATNAFDASHAYTERNRKGQSGGIIQLIYFCAFIPQIGKNIVDYVENAGAALQFDFSDKGNVTPKNPIEGFYADVKEPDRSNAVGMITAAPSSILTTRSKRAAWKHFPLTYIYCEKDDAITFHLQQAMVKDVVDTGLHVDLVSLKSSHSPFLSMPVELKDTIVRAMKTLSHA